MENSVLNEEQLNEKIQVYPLIKTNTDTSENKKYLYLFSKKSSNKLPTEKNTKNINNSDNIDQSKEKENISSIEDDMFLINKALEQKESKSKRTGDIKSALENFLKKSDLFEKITKFFEETREKIVPKDKDKAKTRRISNESSKMEEEKEKLIEIYINSIISKLAENVVFESYKKNEFILKMNEIGEDCYFLLSGSLSVLKPVEYHIELTYDEYMQYLANLIKNKEYEIINNIRRLNQTYIDMGLAEDIENFTKSYFIIKLKKDIFELFKSGQFNTKFIENRFKLFNLSYEDFNLKTEDINRHIEEIIKGSTLKHKDLKEYLISILSIKKENLSIRDSNPHIFEKTKHKFTIFKYEDFLYLKPGSFFGESALDDTVHKRNASIRAEEDCIILSLKNDIYQNLLYENNKRLKSFDVVFICKNFFFNDISSIIFNRNYFPSFKLITKSKDDIIYKQSEEVTSVYFVKEGNIKLDIFASVTELYNLIKYYYDKLTTNSFIKIGQTELKEIKSNYLDDKIITDIHHQSQIMKEKLNTKMKFELYTSNYCDTLGLEEFFLKNKYLCTCHVISKDAKIFEIGSDSLNNIITNEKNCHSAYYNFIESKLITLIKRLHMIKINYINQLKYKIKENFFGTEVTQNNLIRGQTGEKKAFIKYFKKKSEPKNLNYFYKSAENEEIKNQNFMSLQKANITLNISRNKKNKSEEKDIENNSLNKSKNIKQQKNLDKYNDLKMMMAKNLKSNIILSRTQKEKEKEIEIKSENDISKRIMETTIIKIGKDSLTLKEIGNRLNSSEPKNLYLSIVKNFFNQTTPSNNSKKFYDSKYNFNLKNTNIKTSNILSLKKHKNFFNRKKSKDTKNNLPTIIINGRAHQSTEINNNDKILFKIKNKNNKYNNKTVKSNKKYKNYFKSLFNSKKNSFNVLLTDENNLLFK